MNGKAEDRKRHDEPCGGNERIGSALDRRSAKENSDGPEETGYEQCRNCSEDRRRGGDMSGIDLLGIGIEQTSSAGERRREALTDGGLDGKGQEVQRI